MSRLVITVEVPGAAPALEDPEEVADQLLDLKPRPSYTGKAGAKLVAAEWEAR